MVKEGEELDGTAVGDGGRGGGEAEVEDEVDVETEEEPDELLRENVGVIIGLD